MGKLLLWDSAIPAPAPHVDVGARGLLLFFGSLDNFWSSGGESPGEKELSKSDEKARPISVSCVGARGWGRQVFIFRCSESVARKKYGAAVLPQKAASSRSLRLPSPVSVNLRYFGMAQAMLDKLSHCVGKTTLSASIHGFFWTRIRSVDCLTSPLLPIPTRMQARRAFLLAATQLLATTTLAFRPALFAPVALHHRSSVSSIRYIGVGKDA